MAHQIRTIANEKLAEQCGTLTGGRIQELVRRAILLHLGFT
ncbi:MAG: hypothetical protein ACPLQO_06860 [Desulfotomaculales bacterium]